MRPTPEVPGPNQVTVWDFPRPPAYVQWQERVEIWFGGSVIASTTDAWCVLETSHPPAYYLPRSAFITGTLRPAQGSSFCEWKGQAVFYDVVAGEHVAPQAAWAYPAPDADAEVIRDHVAVYPALMDSCTVDGELVTPQLGGFYGGWITRRVVGPFKGGPGTRGW